MMIFVCVVGTMGDLLPFMQVVKAMRQPTMVFACPDHAKYVKSVNVPFRSIDIPLNELVDDCLDYDYPMMSTTWLWKQYRKDMPNRFKAANAKIIKYAKKYKPKLVIYNSPFCGLRKTLNYYNYKHLEVMHFPYTHEIPLDHPLLFNYRDSMTHTTEDTWSVFRGLTKMMDSVVDLEAPDITEYAYIYDPVYAPGVNLLGFVWPPTHNFEPTKELLEFLKYTTVYVTLSACPENKLSVINQWLSTTYLNVLVYGLKPTVKRHNIMYQRGLIDHHWLFPRVKCILNYGGIGTVAMALRYQTPMVVWPMTIDGYFNADAMREHRGGVIYDGVSDLDTVVKTAINMTVPVTKFEYDGLGNFVKLIGELTG